MQQIITAKLKLITTPEQLQALRETQLAYRDALNAVSRYAFFHRKTSSVTTLHKGMYAELRARYHLPSQLACSVERQVAATYNGLPRMRTAPAKGYALSARTQSVATCCMLI